MILSRHLSLRPLLCVPFLRLGAIANGTSPFHPALSGGILLQMLGPVDRTGLRPPRLEMLRSAGKVHRLRDFFKMGNVDASTMATLRSFVAGQVKVVADMVDGEPIDRWSYQAIPEEAMGKPGLPIQGETAISVLVDTPQPFNASSGRILLSELQDFFPRRIDKFGRSGGITVLPLQMVMLPTQFHRNVVDGSVAMVHNAGATRCCNSTRALSNRRIHGPTANATQMMGVTQSALGRRSLTSINRTRPIRSRFPKPLTTERIAVTQQAKVMPVAQVARLDRSITSIDGAIFEVHPVMIAHSGSVVEQMDAFDAKKMAEEGETA